MLVVPTIWVPLALGGLDQETVCSPGAGPGPTHHIKQENTEREEEEEATFWHLHKPWHGLDWPLP